MTSGKRNLVKPAAASAWLKSTAALAVAGAVLLWMAFPPVGLAWLAWVAPLPWLLLIRREQLLDRRAYLILWLAGLIHWLAMLQGIRLAHWLNHFGWLTLSAYLAVYLPVFVGLTRVAVHAWRLPLLVAAPVVWVGLELLRGHLFTGFSMGLLGHVLYEYPHWIQIADLFGAYGVSFMIMLTLAGVTSMLPLAADDRQQAWRYGPLVPVAAVLLAALGYGRWQYQRDAGTRFEQPLKVALIQCNFNTRFVSDPERDRRTFASYWERTLEARDRNARLDLVIWPESVYTESLPELLVQPGATLPEGLSQERLDEHAAAFTDKTRQAAERLNRRWDDGQFQRENTYLLVGTESVELSARGQDQYNTALFVDPSGGVAGRYYKMHPVMFGEYIPFGSFLPRIYEWAPLGRGLTPGPGASAFSIRGVSVSPSICFESAVPHLIRRQVVDLTDDGNRPDVLVNMTHDGWFWGSSILDLQLAGAVFRAVELRRPFLVAANAGISAAIDPRGRITARGPRQGEATIITRVESGGWDSWYLVWGDLPSAACLLFVAVLAVKGVLVTIRKPRL
jgi:apolipoprotein N-acyltransferase